MGIRDWASGTRERKIIPSSLLSNPQCLIPNPCLKAFTLVEIGIVLSVIGLILGGIIIGKTVVRGTQIKSVAVDEQRYVNAALAFQQKYNALPGDFAFATNYWSAMGTCPPTYGTTNSSGGTCSGNGDGQVSPTLASNVYEMFYFWQHLANAQLIQGNYSGIAGSAGTLDSVPGTNVPASRVQGAGFSLGFMGVYSHTGWFSANYGHAMFFGAYHSNTVTDKPSLTALEAQEFDNKYDDRSPATGTVMSYTSATYPSCVTSAAVTATYSTSTTGPQCNLIFITGF